MAALLHALTSRVVPALLTALGVVLITAGLLTYPDPTTAGTAVVPTPEIIEAPSEVTATARGVRTTWAAHSAGIDTGVPTDPINAAR